MTHPILFKLVLSFIILALILLPQHAVAKTQVVKGTLIGAASGAGVGLVSSLIVATSFGCNGPHDADETCASSETQTYIVLGSTLGAIAIGAGIGALIGSLIPKKEKLSIAPVINYHPRTGTTGRLLLSREF